MQAVPTDAIRVFCGYKKSDLSYDQFLLELGSTFMPGTPYMLKPLGLLCYLGAVPTSHGSSTLPEEVALIGYPSQDDYRRARQGTLRGRLYTHTHAAVYHPTKRLSGFPLDLAKIDTRSDFTAYLFNNNVDWQTGDTTVQLWDCKLLDLAQFRALVHKAMKDARQALIKEGVDQCIIAVGDSFLVAWVHYPNCAPATYTWPALEQIARRVYHRRFRKVHCADYAEGLIINEGDAWNFILP